tara:strand:- start:1495 stop:2517 length:1023 start_codon:yes stop_codon:yes gene_type:complete
MNPGELIEFIEKLISKNLNISAMIWGPPGIGKSSIVASAAEKAGIDFIDLRLSQLAPTDLRGLPVPVHPSKDDEQGISKWYPPEFLPRDGKGILFLDELNMAPPVMQGVAQQLILDRKIGSYKVPDGWLILSAGNRKEDRASVFEMPSPLANRFIHIEVEANYESFKNYAISKNLAEEVTSFLAFRPKLLHAMKADQKAWPSPRSWEMASNLFKCNLPIDIAIGEGTASEFKSYINVYKKIPNLENILKGKGKNINFPKQISSQWATTTGLIYRSKNPREVKNVFVWLIEKSTPEWIQLYASDIVNSFKSEGKLSSLAKIVMNDSKIIKYFKDFEEILNK